MPSIQTDIVELRSPRLGQARGNCTVLMTSVISCFPCAPWHTRARRMISPPPLEMYTNRRASRFRLAETTPAVLQFPDSSAIACELQTISRTGGVLSVCNAVDRDSVATLMFRTHKGLVFATAEMLPPLSRNEQPFRFVELKEDDKRRLLTAFQSGPYRNIQEEELIEEFRAAIVDWDPPRRRHFFRPVLAAATLATLCCSVLYVLSAHLR